MTVLFGTRAICSGVQWKSRIRIRSIGVPYANSRCFVRTKSGGEPGHLEDPVENPLGGREAVGVAKIERLLLRDRRLEQAASERERFSLPVFLVGHRPYFAAGQATEADGAVPFRNVHRDPLRRRRFSGEDPFERPDGKIAQCVPRVRPFVIRYAHVNVTAFWTSVGGE